MGELYETNYLNKASVFFFQKKKKTGMVAYTCNTVLRSYGRQEHQKFKIISACTSRSKPGRVNMKTVCFYILREYYILQKTT